MNTPKDPVEETDRLEIIKFVLKKHGHRDISNPTYALIGDILNQAKIEARAEGKAEGMEESREQERIKTFTLIHNAIFEQKIDEAEVIDGKITLKLKPL